MKKYIHNNKVLFVDDEPAVLLAVSALLSGEDIAFRTLSDSNRIEEVLNREGPFAVVYSDQRMPGLDGVSVLSTVARMHPNSIRVMITGTAGFSELQSAINVSGITSFVQKPWNDEELVRLTLDCIARFNLMEEKVFLVNQLSATHGPLAEFLDGRKDVPAVGGQEAQEVINVLLRERELMMQEIHHRVKNNLQVITSLLNLQLSRITNVSTRSIFEVSVQRIRSMALAHQSLYQSGDLGRIDFTEYTRSLVSGIARAHDVEAISWVVEGDRLLVGIETAIPLGLIVNEFVTNAFVHAFPHDRSGYIVVALSRIEGGQLRVIVKDNGCGLREDLDLNRIQTLGLGLAATLVEQLDGQMSIRRSGGTECSVTVRSAPSRDNVSRLSRGYVEPDSGKL
jgi:two-component sensor histidine kinase